jgi:hypothetical protein
MKLRIRGNSIRLRLSQGEVERFSSDGRVEETVDFGSGKRGFTYALMTVSEGGLSAEFDGGRLCVCVPEGLAREWISSERVGFGSAKDAGGPRILVEKDFACITPRDGEDESDMYPHPQPAVC